MTNMVKVIFEDLGILRLSMEFSCLYIPQLYYFISRPTCGYGVQMNNYAHVVVVFSF